MRSFVLFLFSSYFQAAGMVLRVFSVYYTALSYGTVEKLEVWQIFLIVGLLMLTLPLFLLLVGDRTPPCRRWSAFFVCIGCIMGSILVFCYPVHQWPQGVFFGVIGVLGILWLVIGWQMIARYCFLV